MSVAATASAEPAWSGPALCLLGAAAIGLVVLAAATSIAAVLLATSPIFALILESWSERRMIRPRALVGTLLAIAGVAWLVSGPG